MIYRTTFLRRYPQLEFNLEGNPFPEFMEIVSRIRPDQCTLVSDSPDAPTSDHGWDLELEGHRLAPIIAELHQLGARVSVFMDAGSTNWERVPELGADRVELYTQPYAEAFARNDCAAVFEIYAVAAEAAQSAGLGVNAGHDLNLQNLARFCEIPGISEVSIGHALVADALEMGLAETVRSYLRVLSAAESVVLR